jgi:hypothetical protein
MGLTLSTEKTSITHWEKPITFLGYHIRGIQRINGIQIQAILSIPKEKERTIRRELVRVAGYHHIPEIDAMLAMNAKFRGWCHYYKYANNPQEAFKPTVCPSVASRNLLLYQSLPTCIPVSTGQGEEAKR